MNKATFPVTCEGCTHCTYFGEGNFLCMKDEPFNVIEDFIPVYFPNECGEYEEE